MVVGPVLLSSPEDSVESPVSGEVFMDKLSEIFIVLDPGPNVVLSDGSGYDISPSVSVPLNQTSKVLLKELDQEN